MPADEHVASLKEEIAQLRDLFQRRLFEDKAKNRLYEELYDQLAMARGGLTEQLLAPLFRELLLVVDRIARLPEGEESAFQSIRDELMELMERRGVHPVPVSETFDPAIHEAVRSEPVAEQPPGTILEVVRSGYLLGVQLLRAERVVVAVPVHSSPEKAQSGTAPRQEVDQEGFGG